MNIKLKFKGGDTCFFLHNEQIQAAIVYAIKVFVDIKGNTSIYYQVQFDDYVDPHRVIAESALFKSAEALTKSLYRPANNSPRAL